MLDISVLIVAIATGVLGVMFQAQAFGTTDPILRELRFTRGQVLVVTTLVLLLSLK